MNTKYYPFLFGLSSILLECTTRVACMCVCVRTYVRANKDMVELKVAKDS